MQCLAAIPADGLQPATRPRLRWIASREPVVQRREIVGDAKGATRSSCFGVLVQYRQLGTAKTVKWKNDGSVAGLQAFSSLTY